MDKVSKKSVEFEAPAKGPHHCSQCVHWIASDACELVSGTIYGEDWCKLFKEDKSQHASGHFFKDKNGKIHPITDEHDRSVRHPNESHYIWADELTDRQKGVLDSWFQGGGEPDIKDVSARRSEILDPQEEGDLKAFDAAVDTAPVANGRIYRGITDLSDETFKNLTSSKVFRANTPVSFARSDFKQENPTEYKVPDSEFFDQFVVPTPFQKTDTTHSNAVVFDALEHNAADVSMASPYYQEHEAIVPQGSVYHVTGVDVEDVPHPAQPSGSYKLARVHLKLAEKNDTEDEKASLANARFFRDSKGKVHPITDTTQGHKFPESLEGLQHVRDLGGTTGAERVRDVKGNRDYVIKRGNSAGHIENEMAANQAYQALGVPVPAFKRYVDEVGEPVQLSEYISGTPLNEMPDQEAAYKALSKHFAAHALLANWDAHGLVGDNVQFQGGDVKRPYFVDNGGALEYRAQGARKTAFGPTVPEFDTLRDPSMNRTSARSFAPLSGDEIREQVKGLVGKAQALHDSLPEHLQETVMGRLQDLKKHSDSAKFAINPTTSQVYDLLLKDYPDDVLDWVREATWSLEDVPLKKIDMARRPGGRDASKTNAIVDNIKSGQSVKPIVLVKMSNGKYNVADGYHRTKAYEVLGKRTIKAYVATGVGDHGPWDREMHDAKINLAATESPTRYYRDREGNTHPIFASPGGVREPKTEEEWKNGTTKKQLEAIRLWTLSSRQMRNAANGNSELLPERGIVDFHSYGEALHHFNEAVHTAPEAKGTIYRGVTDLSDTSYNGLMNAKKLKAYGPASFTSDAERVFTRTSPNTHRVMISIDNYHAADISSQSIKPEEAEAVIPSGHKFKVVRKSEGFDKADNGKVGFLRLEQVPDDEPDEEEPAKLSAMMSSGAPVRFFTDKEGKRHPVFEGGETRHPMPVEDWSKGLSEDQKHTIDSWTGTGFGDIKDTSKGKPGMYPLSLKKLHDFNTAIDTAPAVNGRVFRGINRLSDDVFDKITGSTSMTSSSPVSFTANRNFGKALGEYVGDRDVKSNAILFSATKHNAADISSLAIREGPTGEMELHQGTNEKEAVIPKGSTYRVVSKKIKQTPNGRYALMNIEWTPGAEESKVELANSPALGHFFRDREGNIHPIRSSYEPDYQAPEKGEMDMSGDEPKWKQHHKALVADALGSMKGSHSDIGIHISDAEEGAEIPPSGTGKIMRARAEALLWELGHNSRTNDKPLYRGSHKEPDGLKAWSESKVVAKRFAKLGHGQVFVAPKGTFKGLRIRDYIHSQLDDDEKEWVGQTHDKVELAAGPRFFTDAHGTVHPLGENEHDWSKREPSKTSDEWLEKMTEEQNEGLQDWFGGSQHIRQSIKIGNPDSYFYANGFQQALHMAPQYDGVISRGIHNLSDSVFNKITSAKYLRNPSPISFTKADLTDPQSPLMDRYLKHQRTLSIGHSASEEPITNSVLFVADKHNGGDVSSQNPEEEEVIIPSGSAYQVNKIETRQNPTGSKGKFALVHISHVPHYSRQAVEFSDSPTGFFRDHEGHIHPVFQSVGMRHPTSSKTSWKRSLLKEQRQALRTWKQSDPALRQILKDPKKLNPDDISSALYPIGENSVKELAHHFQTAIDTAPTVNGPVHRGLYQLSPEAFDKITKAKVLRTKGPVSSSSSFGVARDSFTSGLHSVVFTLDKHNAADISAITDVPGSDDDTNQEHEAIIPGNSIYKVDSVQVETSPSSPMHMDIRDKKLARIHLTYLPEGWKDKDIAELAAAPTGFFRDHEGNVHPIFKSEGGVRHPMSKDAWLKSFTPEEKSNIYVWTSDSSPMKKAATGRYPYAGDSDLTNQWKAGLDSFNRVVDRAPTYNKTIYRGLHGLSDKTFAAITDAKSFQSKSPASFTGTRDAALQFADYRNGVVFVSETGHHNGAHLRPAQVKQIGDSNENEVVVPQGSVYKVDKVKIKTKPLTGGKQAWIYISHDPNAPLEHKTVKLAV